jgi:transposase-like protein
MPSYNYQFKEQAVRRLMPPNSQTVSLVSRDLGIAAPTLYAWKRHFESKGFLVPANSSNPEKWDAKSKLAAIIQTASMNEAERSVYCREHGLYPEQLDAWKAAIESASNDGEPVSKAALAAERKKNKILERELRRKEKALAETAALLTLSKKARAIWGVNEED